MNKFKIALIQHKTKTTDVQENTALALRYTRSEAAERGVYPVSGVLPDKLYVS